MSTEYPVGPTRIQMEELTMTELTIKCDYCRKAVHPTAGVLWVDMQELPVTADSIPAPWRIAHHECAGPLDASVYAIDLYRAATFGELLWWCAHLAEKDWLSRTDWWDVMHRVSESGHLDCGTVRFRKG